MKKQLTHEDATILVSAILSAARQLVPDLSGVFVIFADTQDFTKVNVTMASAGKFKNGEISQILGHLAECCEDGMQMVTVGKS